MILSLLGVVVPVFVVVGAGYVTRWARMYEDTLPDALMQFAQTFAIPVLLFRAISQLDLSATFAPALLGSFYAGAIVSFTLCLLGARHIFDRPWDQAVAIGFAGLFSNSLLLGIPITERAYGTEALTANFAIIALHSPICYGIGITAIELARASGTPKRQLPLKVARSMLRTPLVLGILAGVVFNLTGLTLAAPLAEAADLMIRAALPTALFALGGILYRYRPEGDAATIAMICAGSLLVHPLTTFGLAHLLHLDTDALRSATVTASMAPGINAYIFANIYNVAKRVNASAVLIATAITPFTTTVWLLVLP